MGSWNAPNWAELAQYLEKPFKPSVLPGTELQPLSLAPQELPSTTPVYPKCCWKGRDSLISWLKSIWELPPASLLTHKSPCSPSPSRSSDEPAPAPAWDTLCAGAVAPGVPPEGTACLQGMCTTLLQGCQSLPGVPADVPGPSLWGQRGSVWSCPSSEHWDAAWERSRPVAPLPGHQERAQALLPGGSWEALLALSVFQPLGSGVCRESLLPGTRSKVEGTLCPPGSSAQRRLVRGREQRHRQLGRVLRGLPLQSGTKTASKTTELLHLLRF